MNIFLRGISILALLAMLFGCRATATKVEGPPNKKPEIVGEITELNGASMLVEENPHYNGGDKIQTTLTKETKYWIKDGRKRIKTTKEIMKKGMTVEVWYTRPIAESYSGQGTASHVVIPKSEIEPTGPPYIIGYIASIHDGGNSFLVKDHPEERINGMHAGVSPTTRYFKRSEDGFIEGKKSDLKKGMKVEVWHKGLIMTSSPSQGMAKFIVYYTGDEAKDRFVGKPHLTGYITSLSRQELFVEEDPTEKWNSSSKMHSLLSEKTTYWVKEKDRWRKGKREELKRGMKVEVWYDEIINNITGEAVHVIYHPEDVRTFKPVGKANYVGTVKQVDLQNKKMILQGKALSSPYLIHVAQVELDDRIYYWIRNGDKLVAGSPSDIKNGTKIEVWYDGTSAARIVRLEAKFIVISEDE